jgi:hypothetical protein
VVRQSGLLSVIVTLALASTAAQGATLTFSDVSSDATPSSQLDATALFEVGEYDAGNAGDELRITLTNPSVGQGGDALFNVTELFWNASANVTGLALLSATHSANGDVLSYWAPLATNLMADGFDTFDYSLMDGVGSMSPGTIMPGQNVVFILDIASAVAVFDTDFIELSAMGYLGAAKFVNGPDDPEAPGMEDSAWGAIVPEPGTFGLLASGLVLLAARARRRSL